MSICLTGPESLQKEASPLEFRESDARCLEIGVVNNMPDTALEATERQFLELLCAAADGLTVRLTLYALEGVSRSDTGERHIAIQGYSDVGELWDRRIDGLI